MLQTCVGVFEIESVYVTQEHSFLKTQPRLDLSTVYLLTCEVTVIVSDSGLCCCVPCYMYYVCRAILSPFVDSSTSLFFFFFYHYCRIFLLLHIQKSSSVSSSSSLWGHYGLCPRSKPTELAPSFFVLLLCLFLSLWPFQLYFIPQTPPLPTTTLRLLTLFFRFFSCLIGPFNYIPLYESPPSALIQSFVVDWELKH